MRRRSNPRRKAIHYALGIGACLCLFVIYAADVTRQPPGFYIDESSIAYNAHTICHAGTDEYGTAFPLYFRAFGDYKNPVYVYLLAGIFRITGPGIAAARQLSTSLGALAAVLLGVLAFRLSNRLTVGFFVGLSAALTPWLYESSRLALEASAYPLAVVLFLLALDRASNKQLWSTADVGLIAVSLALLTYTYSIGRLLAPSLGVGLLFFARRSNLRRVMQVWAAYAVTMVPLAIFSLRHPGALTDRFKLITYARPGTGGGRDVAAFLLHYIRDINPWRWLVTGESNIRDHIPGTPALLAVTVLLASSGLVIVLRSYRHQRWWQFQIYALAVSIVPAALTTTDFPQLRLIAFPIFLHLFLVPSAGWLLQTGMVARSLLYVFTAAMLLQGFYFQWLFHLRPPERWYVFDARFPAKIFAPALTAAGPGIIYLEDTPGHSGYIQALWYGTLQHVPASRFRRLGSGETPPVGAIVISTAEECPNGQLLARSINYIVYAVEPTNLRPFARPMVPAAMRAAMSISKWRADFVAAQTVPFEVVIRNIGTAEWPAVGGVDSNYSVRVRDRWLRADGSVVTDRDASARIPYDMKPGDTAAVTLNVTAPREPGDYVVVFDIVQEGVGAFSSFGSQALTFPAKVSAQPVRSDGASPSPSASAR